MPSDSRYWSREFVKEFLDLYKKSPCLWKVNSKVYTNRNLKNAAYDRLTELCRTIDPEASRDYVVKKIQSFRGSFRKEYNKVRVSKKTRPTDVHVPSLWYYDLLLFTVDQELPSQSDDSVNKHEDSEEEENDTLQTEEVSQVRANMEVQISIPAKSSNTENTNEMKNKRKRNSQTNDLTQYWERQLEKIDNLGEYDAAAISWSRKLKRMDPIQAVYAEMLVNKTLSMGLLNQLQESTDVTNQRMDISGYDNDSSHQEISEHKPSISFNEISTKPF